jgi:hypothetical protein
MDPKCTNGVQHAIGRTTNEPSARRISVGRRGHLRHSPDAAGVRDLDRGAGHPIRINRRRPRVTKFMDVHSGFFGVTAEQLAEAHQRDLDIESDEGVHFERAWLDPEAGKVFCLATGPSKEAVMRIHERAGHPTTEVYELPIEV